MTALPASYDAYRLSAAPYRDGLPCGRCEHAEDAHGRCDENCPDEHDGDMWCSECNGSCAYYEAEPCYCGALVSRDCRCD